MILHWPLGPDVYRIDLATGTSLAIPVQFDGPQPNTYEMPPASRLVLESEHFVGDTRRGGGCNVEQYTLIPHCNGTHTEGPGHITDERLSVLDSLVDSWGAALLLTVDPVRAGDTKEQYMPRPEPDDLLITRAQLEAAHARADWPRLPPPGLVALVLRTRPNPPEKRYWRYGARKVPFFSVEAMDWVVEGGFRHLLTDLPSVDRMLDGGRLEAHHRFWGMPSGSHAADDARDLRKTITELIYVPNSLDDGLYVLDLQVAPFAADAAPSQPVLYRPERMPQD